MAVPNIVQTNAVEFVGKLLECNDSNKIITEFVIPPNKRIKDLYTNVINKYICKNPERINEYIRCVMQAFGNYDASRLSPRPNNNIRRIFTQRHFTFFENDNDYMNVKGYFVFKGGNTIKYWTLRNYTNVLTKMLKNNIGVLLSSRVEYDDKVINSYSDFDFSLYVSNFPNKADNFYRKLLLKVYERSYLLKNKLTEYFDQRGIEEILKNLNTSDINCEIFTYFANNGIEKQVPSDDITDTITNKLVNKDELIIVRNNNNIDIFKLKISHNKYINFSFNNTVKFNNVKNELVDFDLARLKVNFNCESNRKQENFSGELFDLSISKQEDSSRQHFCDEINKNTNILDYVYNGEIIYMRIYSIQYLLKDLLGVLFISTAIFPWLDNKYKKRIDRLGMLFSQYAENLYRTSDKTAPLILLSMYKLYSYLCNSYKQNNYDINTVIGFINEFIASMNFNRYNISIEMTESLLDARELLSNPYANITEILNKLIHKLDNGHYFGFMYVYLILIIRKVYIDEDIEWCKKNLPNDFPIIDIHVFKQELFKFASSFITSLTSGILNLTQLPNAFDMRVIMQQGGDPTVLQMNHIMANPNLDKNNIDNVINKSTNDKIIILNDEYLQDLVTKLNRISKFYAEDPSSKFNFNDLHSEISYHVVPRIIPEAHLQVVCWLSAKLIRQMTGVDIKENNHSVDNIYVNASMIDGKIRDYEDY